MKFKKIRGVDAYISECGNYKLVANPRTRSGLYYSVTAKESSTHKGQYTATGFISRESKHFKEAVQLVVEYHNRNQAD